MSIEWYELEGDMEPGALPSGNATESWMTGIESRMTDVERDVADFTETVGGLPTFDVTGIAAGDLLQYDGTNLVKYTPEPIEVPFAISAIANGGGSEPSTGTQGVVFLPFACEIVDWRIYNHLSGSIEWDLYVGGVSITGTNKPKTTSANNASMSTLAGWTTSLSANTPLEILINSVATVTVSSFTVILTRDLTWGS